MVITLWARHSGQYEGLSTHEYSGDRHHSVSHSARLGQCSACSMLITQACRIKHAVCRSHVHNPPCCISCISLSAVLHVLGATAGSLAALSHCWPLLPHFTHAIFTLHTPHFMLLFHTSEGSTFTVFIAQRF